MAYVTIVLNTSESITQLNDRLSADSTSPQKAAQQLENLTDLIKAGNYSGGTLQITTRDTDPSVSTHGSSSKQTTYTLA